MNHLPDRINILLVEDEVNLCNLLKEGLEQSSSRYHILHALSGEEAAEIINTNPVDVLITDIRMPGIDGIELIKLGIKKYPDLQSIVITGHGDLSTAIDALRFGATNYFQKPISIKILHLAIEKSIEKLILTRQIAASEKKYRSLFDLSPDGIIIYRNHRIMLANPAAVQLLGCGPGEDLLGKNILDFVHPDFKNELGKIGQAASGEQSSPPPVIEKFIRLDALEIDVEIRSMPFSWQDQPATQLIIRDITERRRKDTELHQYRDHLEEIVSDKTKDLEKAMAIIEEERELYREGPLAIIRWVKKGGQPTRINYVSPNITRFGFTPEELISGKINLWRMIHPDDYKRVKSETKTFFLNSENYLDQEFRIIVPGGNIRWLHYILRRHNEKKESGDRVYHSFILDITHNKTAQYEVEKQRAQLVKSQRLVSLGKMATGIGHELTQPLAIIRAQTEIMQLAFKKGKLPDRDFIHDSGIIIEEIDRAVDIIDRLRDFASGSMTSREEVDLKDLVDKTLIFFREQFRNREIDLIVNAPEDLPTVFFNATRFQQIFLNIVSNARDAVEHPDCTNRPKTVTINLAHRAATEAVCLEVADNGIGMTEEELEHCFDPFFSGKEVGEGTGLGLSIVHGIVNEFGGSVDVESSIGVGTTIGITIPVKTT
ncbi:MAG: PAS domain S-box protein [FCB group bacterium]|nr:PAS domain S-box protein [FCB group bacterium]